jgi:hypothetical protein
MEIAIAKIITGKARSPSIKRIMMKSHHLPPNVEANPNAVPTRTAKKTDKPATQRDILLPYITRLNKSRPISSVPNQCWELDDLSIYVVSGTFGSNGAIKGPNIATKTIIDVTINPITPEGVESTRRIVDH